MGTPNTYTVTVSRIDVTAYQDDPHFAMDAHTVTLTPGAYERDKPARRQTIC